MKIVPTNITFQMQYSNIYCDYRATAYAMMRRLNYDHCIGSDGIKYTIEDMENSIINPKKQ